MKYGEFYNKKCTYQHLLGTTRLNKTGRDFPYKKDNIFFSKRQRNEFNMSQDFPPLPVLGKFQGEQGQSVFLPAVPHDQAANCGNPFKKIFQALEDLQKQNLLIKEEFDFFKSNHTSNSILLKNQKSTLNEADYTNTNYNDINTMYPPHPYPEYICPVNSQQQAKNFYQTPSYPKNY